MKKLLFFLSLTFSISLVAQNWQYVGDEGEIGNATEVEIAFANNLDLFIAKKNGTQITIHKWNRFTASWESYASPKSVLASANQMQFVLKSVTHPVISYIQNNEIFVYQYNFGTNNWVRQAPASFNNLTTDGTKEYKLFTENGGDLRLTYFNANPANGEQRLITTYISPTSVTQAGGDIDANDDPLEKNVDFLFSENDEDWVIYDYLGLSHGTSLVKRNGASWSYHNFADTTCEDAKLVEVGNKLHVFFREGGSSLLRLKPFDMNTSAFGSTVNVANISADFVLSEGINNSYVFQKNSFNYTVNQFSQTGTLMNAWTNFGPATAISDLAITTYRNATVQFPVVAFINNGNVSVMELGVNAYAMDYDAPNSICNNGFVHGNFNVSDPNFDNSDASIVIDIPSNSPFTNAQHNPTNSNNVNGVINIGLMNDLTGDHSFDIIYHNNDGSGSTYTETFTYTLLPSPNPQFIALPSNICTGDDPINLYDYVTPDDGIWSIDGGGVLPNGIADPSEATPNTLVGFKYELTNNFGCTSTTIHNQMIRESAEIDISTTSSSCGESNGTATADITLDTDTYEMYWSNGDLGLTADSLEPGMYYINVTTNNGCLTMAPAVIENDDIDLDGNENDASCSDRNDGSINLTVTGSSGPYTYNWSNGFSGEDPSNLLPGPYEVTVTDASGCVASQSFMVESPDGIYWNAGTNESNCGGNNGIAFCETFGGTAPYSWSWTDSDGNPVGSDNDTLANIGGGYYSVLITDANGCTAVWNTTVNEIGGPLVVIDSVMMAGCDNNGMIYTTIDAPGGINEIGWNSGQTAEDISNLTPGYYAIWVVDNSGCTGMANTTIESNLPEAVDVCLVTVDENTTTNKVVWEKPASTTISHFNIYRETSVAGLFQRVDSVLYTEESEFTDPIASPLVRSWRYKISSVNDCGIESALSEYHKTIHLTISQGLNSNINLHWDHYEGFNYTTYELWRHNTAGGWTMIQQLPNNITSYTDVAPDTDGLDYMVVITPPSTCTSEKANDYNTSRSNRSSGVFVPGGGGIGIEDNKINEVVIFPNPSNGQFQMVFENFGKKELTITSQSGQTIVRKVSSKNNIDFDLTGVEAGVYFLSIVENGTKTVKKIVIK